MAPFVEFANHLYLFGREHAIGIPSLLRDCVLDVLPVCAKKQMIWADAKRVVAAVKNFCAFGEWAVMKFPRYSMGAQIFVGPFAGSNLAIAGAECSAGPKPATIGLLYVGPESLLESLSHGRGRF